ncbi:hypothetical protein KY290_005375 [Solanum tuberosum]|uniref:Uncharacterized protein n=1 Tax=Solanum tuberosum TaxID=4113 RepID=A0ABQ7WFU4_SOLTU|nr:hypothetical protein KY290_005375 [Solanum tuberosum]
MHSNNRQVIWLRPTSRDNNIQFASLRYQLDSTHNTSCIPHRRSEGLVKAITTVKYWKLVVVGPEYKLVQQGCSTTLFGGLVSLVVDTRLQDH